MNYKYLTINERVVISQLKSSGYSIRKIAKFLDRSPSTCLLYTSPSPRDRG